MRVCFFNDLSVHLVSLVKNTDQIMIETMKKRTELERFHFNPNQPYLIVFTSFAITGQSLGSLISNPTSLKDGGRHVRVGPKLGQIIGPKWNKIIGTL